VKLFGSNPDMDDATRAALGEAGQRYLKRYEKFDDRAIGRALVAIAEREPCVLVTTRNGLSLTVRRNIVGVHQVSYEAYLEKIPERVAWMHCMVPTAGRMQVSNANVCERDGVDYRRRGIGTAIYGVIEADLRAAGGEGLEPTLGVDERRGDSVLEEAPARSRR
jgi:hypothetical protein